MKTALLDHLRCPACAAPLQSGPDIASPGGGGEVTCTGCAETYPIVDGVPVLIPESLRDEHVMESFGFEWDLYHRGGFEDGTVFGRTLDEDLDGFFEALGIEPSDLDGARVLDAGCGSGVLTIALAERFPTATFTALDLNPAIAHVEAAAAHLPNLHPVRASVFAAPFAPESFDYVWSNGVIHHTGATRSAFDVLAGLVRPGGRLYVWVYERKPSPFVAVRRVLLPLGVTRWRHRTLVTVCRVLAAGSWLGVKALRPLRPATPEGERSARGIVTRDRGFGELALTWFDVLSPQWRDTYRESEVERWFTDSGYTDLRRYWWPVGISGRRA